MNCYKSSHFCICFSPLLAIQSSHMFTACPVWQEHPLLNFLPPPSQSWQALASQMHLFSLIAWWHFQKAFSLRKEWSQETSPDTRKTDSQQAEGCRRVLLQDCNELEDVLLLLAVI